MDRQVDGKNDSKCFHCRCMQTCIANKFELASSTCFCASVRFSSLSLSSLFSFYLSLSFFTYFPLLFSFPFLCFPLLFFSSLFLVIFSKGIRVVSFPQFRYHFISFSLPLFIFVQINLLSSLLISYNLRGSRVSNRYLWMCWCFNSDFFFCQQSTRYVASVLTSKQSSLPPRNIKIKKYNIRLYLKELLLCSHF